MGQCSGEVVGARARARHHENARYPVNPHGCTCESKTKEAACLVLVHADVRSDAPRNFSVFFLMNACDYDRLLNAVIYFCRLCSIHTVALHIYTSDKHFVRSQFILIAALCQRLLMSFYRSLHSVGALFESAPGG